MINLSEWPDNVIELPEDEDARVIRFRELTVTECSPYILKNVIHAGEIVVIYGAAKSGKTFYAFHLAADIANGREHRGRRTRRGLVVHVALESVGAIKQRIIAYKQATGETDLPYVVLDWRLDLFDVNSRDALREKIRELESEYRLPLALLIIDTLARAMPGTDENSRELGDAVAHAHDLVRHHFPEAAVAAVHHAGKDSTKGARGHSSLYGNADGILLVENRDGQRVVSVDVHRNATEGEVIAAFELETVKIGADADGDPITSCVLYWIDTPADRPAKRLTPTERQGIETLREAINAHGIYPPTEILNRNKMGGVRVVEEQFWRDIFYRRRTSADDTQEAKKKAFQRVRDKLQLSRLMQADAGHYWLLDVPGQPGHNGTTQ